MRCVWIRRCRPKERALEADAPGLSEDDARLTPGGCGDVDLGLGLTIGDEEVVAEGRGEERLPVLAGKAEADLGVDAQAGGGVDLQGLPGELALPRLEDETLASPTPLGMHDVALAEGREPRTPGEVIGDHRSAITHHPEPWRGAELDVDVG
jgi:hypothetical protein